MAVLVMVPNDDPDWSSAVRAAERLGRSMTGAGRVVATWTGSRTMESGEVRHEFAIDAVTDPAVSG